MRRWNMVFMILPMMILFALLLSGCYTQVGTVRNDRDTESPQEYTEEDEYAYEDTVSQDQYQDARHQFYFGAYDSYPWLSFGYGYYDPWYSRWAGYYSPYWYDPVWGWCGTSYPRYYASLYGWGRPYDSWNSRGSYTYRTGSNVVVRPGGAYGATRTFGSTRTPAGGTRGGTEVLPSGARAGTGLGKRSTDVPLLPRASTRRAEDRPAGTVSPGSKSGSRSGGSREGTRSGGENRGGNRRYEVAPYNPPASSSPGNSGSGNSGRSGGSSAPASAPSSSPAPSSGGGNAPANTGQRGNDRR